MSTPFAFDTEFEQIQRSVDRTQDAREEAAAEGQKNTEEIAQVFVFFSFFLSDIFFPPAVKTEEETNKE